MTLYPPKRRQFALPEPARVKSFNIAIDYTPIFTDFYEALASVDIPEDIPDSFQGRLVAMTPHDLVTVAMEALSGMIAHGSQYTTGVSFCDIADLFRLAVIQGILFPERDVPSYQMTPVPTPTQQYHVDLLEGQLTAAIEDFFDSSLRSNVHAPDDVLLWRALVAIMIETSRAIKAAGLELNISETGLISYTLEEPKAMSPESYSYVLTLTGP